MILITDSTTAKKLVRGQNPTSLLGCYCVAFLDYDFYLIEIRDNAIM